MTDVSNEVAALFPRRGKELWYGLVFGMLAGAIGMALAAPRSGAATRELLRERSLELKDRADDLIRNRGSRSPL
ncbi:MAG: YtxH domain-containing protein [Oscillochloris sp.]|nr:YtxH domain-containing protein [Oscillochloris sp.]